MALDVVYLWEKGLRCRVSRKEFPLAVVYLGERGLAVMNHGVREIAVVFLGESALAVIYLEVRTLYVV